MAHSGTGPRTATAAQLERARKQADQARRQALHARLQARADEQTAALAERVAVLESVLARGATRDARIDLAARRRRLDVVPLDLGPDADPLPAPDWARFAPRAPGRLGRALGGDQRHAARLATARAQFAEATAVHARAEAARQARVDERRNRYDAEVAQARAAVAAADEDLDRWLDGCAQRRPEEVERYLGEVLAAVPLPAGFPRRSEVTYDPQGEHAVVRFELPGIDVVPTARAVSFVRAKEELREVPRRPQDCQQLYRSVISQVSLLVVRDLLDADDRLQRVSFNGHVSRTHPATGQADYPCLLSVIVQREELAAVVLTNVQPQECLRHLKALVSEHPHQVEAVRPLVDFDRSRFAFTRAVDVVAGLDHRDDLMALTPPEFEHLVRQLFEALPGMQGWTTQASKDDGIDAVIFNDTPITGGLTVVQAKQYSKVVGVDHVRELMGAMEHKRAGRGVVVTTSAFTKGARALGTDYGGRIQLIDGAELVYLMKEHLDLDVVIGRRARRSGPST